MTTLQRSSSSAERPLDRPTMTFDVPAILADLKREATWQTSNRNAVTLLKQPGFRLVLVALQAEAALAPHRTDSAVSIHVLEGKLTVDVGADRYVLAAGRLLTLHPGLDHAVRASTAAAFLLTLAGEALHPAEATPDAAGSR
jgi:quercetin dioxygenase-like cupin family protein